MTIFVTSSVVLCLFTRIGVGTFQKQTAKMKRYSSIVPNEIAHNDEITVIAALSDTEFITGSKDKTVKVWSYENATLTCTRTLTGHQGGVTDLAVCGSNFVSSSKDAALQLVASNRPKIVDGHEAAVTSVVAWQDGSYIISGDANGVIKQWTWDGTCQQTIVTNDPVTHITASSASGGDSFIVLSGQKCTQWTRVESDYVASILVDNLKPSHTGMKISPDMSLLFVYGAPSGETDLVDIYGSKIIWSHIGATPALSLAVNPAQYHIVFARANSAQVLDLESKEIIGEINLRSYETCTSVYWLNGTTIVTGTNSGSLYVWSEY